MLNLMKKMNGAKCSCGKTHSFDSEIYSGKGAICNLNNTLIKFGSKQIFVLADKNTYSVGGEKVEKILTTLGLPFSVFIYQESPKPDEKGLGDAVIHCPADADTVIAIGSGVINDIGKMLTAIGNKKYIIVATAPSMDGYASTSSSMCRAGLKVSISSKSADVIIGDTEILKTAPKKMMVSGLGDMLAKYVSICEWRISNLITGEYYCESIAELIRLALKRCIEASANIENMDDASVASLFDGLIIGSVAMNYASISRPASGAEHYISHIVDMRSEEFGTPADFHGIQCAIGTYNAVSLYEYLKSEKISYEKGVEYARGFDVDAWNERLRVLLGKGAESMIALEKKEGKYNKDAHASRLRFIVDNFDKILDIINEELPTMSELDELYERVGIPKSLTEIGVQKALLPEILCAAKDIRDKYVLPRLLWDLGILDEYAKKVK